MRLHLALGLSFAALAACGGDDGGGGSDANPGPIPSASGIFPSSAFTGRTVRVEVSGDATTFTTGATLDFGPGITTANVTVASPTDLIADVTIDPGAMLGARDVTVKNGSETLTLSKAFLLSSPLVVSTAGMFAQGSVASIAIQNLDFTTPFDTTCGFSLGGQCLFYSGTSVTLGTGMTVQVTSIDDYHLTGTVFIDTDAAGGAVATMSGTATTVTSQAGDSVMVSTRTAIAATATAADVNIANPGDSALYTFSTSGVGRIRFDTADPQSGSQVYLLPASGHFADMLVSAPAVDANGVFSAEAVTKASSAFYAIYVDDGLQDPVTAQTANVLLTATVAEVEPNDTAGQAQQLTTAPTLFDAATLSSATDTDWVKFTVAAGDVGKTIRVLTGGADRKTDTVVNAYKANGTTSLGVSDDSNYVEDFTSSPVVAGVNYVKISASSVFNATHDTYIAAIWLE